VVFYTSLLSDENKKWLLWLGAVLCRRLMTNTAFPACMPLGCKACAVDLRGIIYFSLVIYWAFGGCQKNLPHKSHHFLSGKQS
jgi:hypothetical protein